MVYIRWKLQNNVHQCAVPRCKNPIGPTYLGLEICYRCFERHCDKPFLQRYTKGTFSKAYVSGKYYRGGALLVGTSEMGVIKLGDRVKMDPENSGAYSQFLKKGDGKVIGIHPMGQQNLDKTVKRWPLDKVGHLTIQCDNGLVIIIGPSRLAEINGFKRPSEEEIHRRRMAQIASASKRRSARRRPKKPEKPKTLTTKLRRLPKPVKKAAAKRRNLLDDLWG